MKKHLTLNRLALFVMSALMCVLLAAAGISLGLSTHANALDEQEGTSQPHEHTLGDEVYVIYKPTCVAPGVGMKYCTDPDCGEGVSVIIPANGYSHKVNEVGECSICHKTGINYIVDEEQSTEEEVVVKGVPAEDSELTSIVIPEKIDEKPVHVAENAFAGNKKITSVTIKGSASIGESAFAGCTSLSKLTIQEGTETIGENAFNGCDALSEVDIPSTVTSVGRNAFAETEFYTTPANWKTESGFKVLADKDGQYLLKVSAADVTPAQPLGRRPLRENAENGGGKYTVSEGTLVIADGAFEGLTALTQVTLPAGLKTVGADAFKGCALESVIIEAIPEDAADAYQNVAGLNGLGVKIFYKGTTLPEALQSTGNTLYLFSQDEPLQRGNYWYEKEGEPVIWPLLRTENPLELKDYKTEFKKGEPFSSEGLVVTAYYENGDVLTLQPAETTSHGFYTIDSSAYRSDAINESFSIVITYLYEKITYQVTVGDAYIITIEYGNGQPNGTASVTSGEKYTLPAAPVRTGYTFLGWKVGEDAALQQPAARIDVTANITIAAQWQVKTPALAFDLGADVTNAAQLSFAYGELSTHEDGSEYYTVTLTGTPERTGYKFLNWTSSLNDATPQAVEGNSFEIALADEMNVKIGAEWEQLYTVTAATAAHLTITIENPAAYYEKGAAVTFTITVENGFKLGTVSVGTLENGKYTLTVGTENITITATAVEVAINASITGESGGAELGVARSENGATATVTVGTPQRAGYRFDGWTITVTGAEHQVAEDGSTTTLTLANSDVTVTYEAKWTQVFALSVSAENAAVAYNGEKTQYVVGDTVTITIAPNADYILDGEIAVTGAKNFNVQGNVVTITFTAEDSATVTVTATLVRVYKVTLDQETYTGATVSLDPAQETYKSGSTVTLKIEVTEGYKLKSLKFNTTDKLSEFTGNSYEFQVTENITIEIEIVAVYSVTYTAEDMTGVENMPEAETEIETFTLPAKVPTKTAEDKEYTFLYWYYKSGEEEIQVGESFDLAAAAGESHALTLYAKFAETHTAKTTIPDYAKGKGWKNGTQYETIELDNNIIVTAVKTTSSNNNTGKYYDNNSGNGETGKGEWKLYQTEGPELTFKAENDAKIVSIKITYNQEQGGILLSSDKDKKNTYKSGDLIQVNADKVVLNVGNEGTANKGQVKITAIEVVYSGGIYLSNADKAENALQAIQLDTTEKLTKDLALPTSTVPEVTFKWTVEVTTQGVDPNVATIDAENGILKITQTAEKVVLQLVAHAYIGEQEFGNGRSFTLTIEAKEQLDPNVANFDFSTNFETYAKTDWSSYGTKTVDFTAIGMEAGENATGLSGQVEFSKVSKQSNTIKDCPVMVANESTVYVTVELGEQEERTITAFEFGLKQWGTKKFSDIHLEYKNGAEWLSCSDNLIKKNGNQAFGDELSITTISSNQVITDAKQVRLSITTTLSSNQQIGIASMKLTVATPDPDVIAAQKALAEAQSQIDTFRETLNNSENTSETLTLPENSNDVQFAWTLTDNGNGVAALADGKTLTVTFAEEARDVTLKVTATCNGQNAEATFTLHVPAHVTLTGDGSSNNPFTVADALKLAGGLTQGSYYNDGAEVYVKGFVIVRGEWSTKNNNIINAKIADSADEPADKGILVFGLEPDGTILKSYDDFEVGAEIVLKGYITNYNGTLEITYYNNVNVTATYYKKSVSTHEHVWEYQYSSDLKHTRVCNVPDCPLKQEVQTENCNCEAGVCVNCQHKALQDETLTALKGLAADASLNGTYELTGTVSSDGVTKTGSEGDWQFNITVNGTEIMVYYASHDVVKATTLEKGDLVTVVGSLTNYQGKTLEFKAGSKITDWQKSDQQKVDAVEEAIGNIVPKTFTENYTLPTLESLNLADYLTANVSITWEVSVTTDGADPESAKIVDGVLQIKRGETDIVCQLIAKITSGNIQAHETSITITISAQSSGGGEGGGDEVETKSLTLTNSNFGLTTSYGDNTTGYDVEEGGTKSGIKISYVQLLDNNYKGTHSIQGNKSKKSNLQNTTAFPGKITSVVLTPFKPGSGKATAEIKCSFGTDTSCSGSSSTGKPYDSTTTGDLTFKPQAGESCTFFKLEWTAEASYYTAIVINYEAPTTSGGGGGETEPGEKQPITVTLTAGTNSLNLTGNSGYTPNNQAHVVDEISFTTYQVMLMDGDKMQFQRGKGYIHNDEAFPGRITKIEIVKTDGNVTLSLGTSSGSINTSKDLPYTAADGDNYTFFEIKADDSTTPKLTSIKITYETASADQGMEGPSMTAAVANVNTNGVNGAVSGLWIAFGSVGAVVIALGSLALVFVLRKKNN